MPSTFGALLRFLKVASLSSLFTPDVGLFASKIWGLGTKTTQGFHSAMEFTRNIPRGCFSHLDVDALNPSVLVAVDGSSERPLCRVDEGDGDFAYLRITHQLVRLRRHRRAPPGSLELGSSTGSSIGEQRA